MSSANIAYVDNLPLHIKKGHQLVFSRQDLSAREADLFALMMSFMKPADWNKGTPSYDFPCAKLSEWLDIEAKHVGTVLSPIADRLAERKIGINTATEKGETEFDYVPLFKRIRYKSGVLRIIPNDELKSEYIEYHKGFALINTVNFLGLKREYSKRLYELLSRFKDSGTTMRSFPLDELKGMFGILDENDKLKSDKKSFSNNGVFMQRCIRESINELMENPNTKKELMFLPSKKGEMGYQAGKVGNKIISAEFLYRWVSGTTTIETFNEHNAEKTIRELEIKRLQYKETLTSEELELLASAYKSVGLDDKATMIINSLASRNDKIAKENLEKQEDNSLESLLSKLQTISAIEGDPGY